MGIMTRLVSEPKAHYGESKNIYWKKLTQPPEELKGLAFTDLATEQHRGAWREHFKAWDQNQSSKNKPILNVEIGCNAGHVSVEWAKLRPEERFIGIDWKFKQIYRMAEKIQKAELKNLLAFRANADRMNHMFAPGEIDAIHMFFPDPWPKSAQKKNRTANREWLRSIAPLLASGGIFHLKTDHDEYFEFIVQELEAVKDVLTIKELTSDLHAKHPDPKSLKIPDVTLFERLFIKDGIKIKSVVVSCGKA